MALKLGELVAIISADDSKFRKTLGSVKAGLDRVAKFAGFTALAGSATTFAAAVAPAIGAVAAAPAVFAAAKVASLGLQMALEGVSDTLGHALVGDTEKFNEALAELPPHARAVVSELGVAFSGLQERTQNAFFGPMRAQARGLGADLRGPIHAGMAQVGDALGRIGASLIGVAREGRSLRFIGDLFNWTAGAIDGIGAGIPPLVRGLRDLAGVGLEFVDRSAASLGGLMARFGRWLSEAARSGQAYSWLENAAATLTQLGRIASNLGTALGEIFGAAGAGAGDLLGSLERITAAFAQWTQSAEGQQALGNFFSTLNQTAADLSVVLPVLGGALGLVADIIGSMPPEVRGVVTQMLAWSLVTGLVVGRLGPLVGGIGRAAGAVGKFGGVLGKAGGPLRTFGGHLANVGAGAGRMAAAVATSAGRVAASWATMAARALMHAARMAASWVIAMGPVGWAVAAVVGAVALIIANWDKVSRFFTKTLPAAIRRGLEWAVGFVGRAWDSITQAAGRGVSRTTQFVQDIPGRILRATGNFGRLLYSAGRDLLVGLWNGMVSASQWLYNAIMNLVRRIIPGPVRRVLGIASPSKLFAEYGRNLAEGMALGMDRSAGLVAGAAARLADTAATGARLPVAAAAGAAGAAAPAVASAAAACPADVRVSLDVTGTDRDLVNWLRKVVRVQGGGNVQVAFGR